MIPDLEFTALVSRQFWQLSIVLLIVSAITLIGCRRRPHLAYALWMVVLVKSVTPPLWLSNLSLFSMPGASEPQWLATTSDAHRPIETSPSEANATENTALPDLLAVPLTTHELVDPLEQMDWFEIAFVVWLVGAVVLAMTSIAIVGLRWRRISATVVPLEPRLQQAVAEIAETLGIRRSVRVLVTTAGYGPALFGIWRPTIVLPQCVLGDKSPEDWRPYLTHELVHLRRNDHLAATLQSLVQVLWWFHPLVWWMNRQICQVRERCCDQESVCALAEPPARYAHCLLNVLDAKSKLRPVYGFPGVRPVQVTTQRLQEIMTMSATFQSRTPAWCWALALLLAVAVLPGMPLAGQSAQDAVGAETETEKTETPPPAKEKPEAKKPLLLKYGDNKPDGRKSIAGSGEMIRFDLPGDTGKLRAVRVHGSRYGYAQAPKEDFEVTILSADMKEVLHTELVPYSLFKRTKAGRWTHVPFKEAVELPKTFWVVLNFNAERTKGVYVSYDTSTKGKYSRVGTSDEDAKKTKFGGDWMIQARLAPSEKSKK